jgi:hypothetical protein
MRRGATCAALLALVLAGVALADVHAPAAGRITVGRNATIEAATVRLADVAILEGNGSDFADVDLGFAPDPGGSRRLDGVAILRSLRAAGLDDGATRYEIPACASRAPIRTSPPSRSAPPSSATPGASSPPGNGCATSTPGAACVSRRAPTSYASCRRRRQDVAAAAVSRWKSCKMGPSSRARRRVSTSP